MVNLCLLITLVAADPALPPSELAVMPLRAERMAPETVRVLDSLLVSALHASGKYAVIGTEDINAMLGLEEMKDALGCDDASCAAEIGGALGVSFLVTGVVGRLGDEVIVQLSLVNVKDVSVVGRGQAVVPNDESQLRGAVERAVAAMLSLDPVEAQDAAVEPGETSPARLRFETRNREREFSVRVVSASGTPHRCALVSIENPCVLKELAPGEGILTVMSGELSPFSRSLDIELDDDLFIYRMIEAPSAGSVVSWTFGGLGVATGAALLGVGLGTDRDGMTTAGALSAVVGGGLVLLGFLFDGDVFVDYPGWWR